MTTASLALRPATDEDRPFLLRVYGSTRADELALVDWPEETKRSFVQMQFDAQDRHYRESFPGATWDVVVVDGEAAGRLYLDRWPGEVRIIDVALLPEWRNAGVGTVLLERVLAAAAASGRKVSIHVEVFNPARRLYERLGFREVQDLGVHVLMEWRPSGDDGLVAHPAGVRADGDEEERQLAQVGVVDGEDLLWQEAPVGGVEQQGERHPARVAGGGGGAGEAGLLAGRQHQVEGLALGRDGTEGLPDQGGEGGAGEALEHGDHPTGQGGEKRSEA